jgi:hypothetical protein
VEVPASGRCKSALGWSVAFALISKISPHIEGFRQGRILEVTGKLVENQSENSAKAESEHFGGYECLWCGSPSAEGKWISTRKFIGFIALIDHLIYHHGEDPKKWEEAGRKQDENPYDPNVFWKTLDQLRHRKGPIQSAKEFLPSIADWLEAALASIPELDNTTEGNLLLANKLAAQVTQLPEMYREQREYLLAHKEQLRDAAMDPKWPHRRGNQSRFVAESVAGAKWGYRTTSSREFIRKERPRTKSEIPVQRKEGRWWEVSHDQGSE